MRFIIKDLETKEVRELNMKELLAYINNDRSDTWIDYDESDWQDGWDNWCEGEFVTLVKVIE